MQILDLSGLELHLLPEKAIYLPAWRSLLVADVHLGKSETFQAFGIPVPSGANQTTLQRLQKLCAGLDLQTIYVLGDLFHSAAALTPEILDGWQSFLEAVNAEIWLLIGNHDRRLTDSLRSLPMRCSAQPIEVGNLWLSHEPSVSARSHLNICGHVHPCIRLQTRLDRLRLPCFYFNPTNEQLILPSFGEFTGGYEVSLQGNAVAYAIAEDEIFPVEKVRH